MLIRRTYYDAEPIYQREQTPNWYQQLPRTNQAFVAALKALVEGKRVLEVGCGGGWLIPIVRRGGGCSYRGFDFAESAVQASRVLGESWSEAKVFQADALDAAAFRGDFDLIVAHQFAQCLIGEDRLRWLKHARDALKPFQGMLLISSLVGIPEGVRPTLRAGTRINRLRNRYFADALELRSELETAGFAIREESFPEANMAIFLADFARFR